MSKAKKSKPVAVVFEKPADPVRTAAVRRALIHTTAALLLIAGAGVGFYFMKVHVERDVVFSKQPPQLLIRDVATGAKPTWMSDRRLGEITDLAQPRGAHSPFDRELLRDVCDLLKSSTWVKEVKQVRRVYANTPGDTILADVQFRNPVALLHWKDFYWLIDDEGVKLPEQYSASEVSRVVINAGKVNLRVIEGVGHAPVEAGQPWPGADLRAGIDLARILYGQLFAEEILRIDVSNFGGRKNPREAQLNLVTRYGTEIRWGMPIKSAEAFVEITPGQKLQALQRILAKFGRVDARRPWIDIRFDKITYPSSDAQTARGDDPIR